MAGRTFCRRYQNWILTGLFLLLLLVFVGVRYDYYFDLNDDVLMKDILAGVYTGAPESRNIQMRWPISALISLLYRIAGTLPWYGIFLCLCHYGSIALIAHRSLLFCENCGERRCFSLRKASWRQAFCFPIWCRHSTR